MIEEILETVRKLDRGRFSRTVTYAGPDTDVALAVGPLALHSEAGETAIRDRLAALQEISRRAPEQKAKDQETDANDKEEKNSRNDSRSALSIDRC